MFGVTFDDPGYLLGLVVLVGVAVWAWPRGRRQACFRFPPLPLVREAGVGLLGRLHRLPDLLRLVALAALLVALARPQTEDYEILTGEGIDIMVALDMSASMNAVDMPADAIEALLDRGERPRNRFEIARDLIKQFVLNRTEDRVGLVVFGEEAFLKSPLTLDYARLVEILDGLVLDDGDHDDRTGQCTNGCTISGAGTAIGDALARAYRRLQRSTARGKIIVLVTDGKNEGGKLQPDTVARYIASRPPRERVRVYTFLVGSDEETYLPVRTFGGQLAYQRPSRPFPTDPDLLRDIANWTGGRFYESYDEQKFRADFADLERTTFETRTHSRHRDVYGPVLAVGAAAILLEMLLRLLVFRKFP